MKVCMQHFKVMLSTAEIFLAYVPNSPLERKMKSFEKHIVANGLLYNLEEIRRSRSMPLNLERLRNDEEFNRSWPMFKHDLNESTEESLLCAGLGCHQCILKNVESLAGT